MNMRHGKVYNIHSFSELAVRVALGATSNFCEDRCVRRHLQHPSGVSSEQAVADHGHLVSIARLTMFPPMLIVFFFVLKIPQGPKTQNAQNATTTGTGNACRHIRTVLFILFPFAIPNQSIKGKLDWGRDLSF